uniref:Uncharacterized protein n=1 Tax=Arundo donax TaxID=35708 RepID=A0A0A9H856_ARUDO
MNEASPCTPVIHGCKIIVVQQDIWIPHRCPCNLLYSCEFIVPRLSPISYIKKGNAN